MLYRDRRLLGVELWYQGAPPDDFYMRLPKNTVKTAAFLCTRTPRTKVFTPKATGFFVNWSNNEEFPYLVTARHVVEGIQRQGDGNVHVRLNTYDGGRREVCATRPWFSPKGDTVDLAVTPFEFEGDEDIETVQWKHLLNAAQIATHRIDVGDEVWLPGLYYPVDREGQDRPIVRMGTIAAMADGRIVPPPDKRGRPVRPYEAYLVELRSHGGLSGSPVWVHLPLERVYADWPPWQAREEIQKHWEQYREGKGQSPEVGVNYILGVVRTHFAVEGWKVRGGRSYASDFDREAAIVNTGIAAVTPIQALTDLLGSQDVEEERNAHRAKRLKEKGGAISLDDTLSGERTPPGAKSKRLKIDGSFEDAVKRALKKPKPKRADG
jgi:hypothetical protein